MLRVINVIRHGAVVPVSAEVLADAQGFRASIERWAQASPEQREQWAREQQAARKAERDAAIRVPLTLGALLDKLGLSAFYADHLVQTYCECGDGLAGWEYCQHARDYGLMP